MAMGNTYLVGIDIGGTFTDCAIVDGAGKLLTTKVPSTPGDFSRGMMDALGAGAQAREARGDAEGARAALEQAGRNGR